MSCQPPEDPLIIYPHCDLNSYDCPPKVRRSQEFDPHNPPEPRVKPDPRPRLQCTSKACCACRPGPLPKKPMVPNLKLRQLADCYSCRVSEGCYNRRKVFYQRWQTHLDRLPRRMPNMDYSVYSCNDYVDMGVNHDFYTYDTHLSLRKAPRKDTLEHFLWMKNLDEANAEVKSGSFQCAMHEPWCYYQPPAKIEPLGLSLKKKFRLYHEDGISRWNEIEYQPEYKGFVEGATPYSSWMRPFHKDVSFTTPVDIPTGFSAGNQPPYKQIRDLKLI